MSRLGWPDGLVVPVRSLPDRRCTASVFRLTGGRSSNFRAVQRVRPPQKSEALAWLSVRRPTEA